jgi:phenylacetate-CoA ligase
VDERAEPLRTYLSAIAARHQIVITREAAMDELLLRVEANATTHAGGPSGVERFRSDVSRSIQKLLGLRTSVEVAASGSLPRTDFKARRVIDDRAMFRELYAHLEAERGA